MLKYREDWQTVLYMLFTTALPLRQWRLDHFNVVLFIALHESIAGRIDPRLIEKSFISYCLRVFVLGLSIPRLRSVSLRTEKA